MKIFNRELNKTRTFVFLILLALLFTFIGIGLGYEIGVNFCQNYYVPILEKYQNNSLLNLLVQR